LGFDGAINMVMRRNGVLCALLSGKRGIAATVVSLVIGAIAAPMANANIVADPSFELNDGSWTAVLMTIGTDDLRSR
jgi:hypothetical protein